MTIIPEDVKLLEEAISRCGGTVIALAETLRVKQSTAYQWKRRKSLPHGWRRYFAEVLRDPNWPAKA